MARTVEANWEKRLTEACGAEANLAAQRARRPSLLTAAELQWLRHAGADIRKIFDSAATSFRERKQLLRAVITEVVVTIDPATRTAQVVIIWQGGATTEFTME